ncbi:MAG: hypothetical protein ABI702_19605 [Burkholderiales bacterium]
MNPKSTNSASRNTARLDWARLTASIIALAMAACTPHASVASHEALANAISPAATTTTNSARYFGDEFADEQRHLPDIPPAEPAPTF